ncbi:hypothetical protein F5Y18DRAFT_423754 [Xylariaceae sp. FL1019]|nr:hypothetical protein F5Y18DRAFT_423754 [Xylariaceae sp. FL1019]
MLTFEPTLRDLNFSQPIAIPLVLQGSEAAWCNTMDVFLKCHHYKDFAEATEKLLEQCQLRHAKHWGTLVVSSKLLETPMALQKSILLKLPPEVLLMVFEHLHPLAKMCLALSCKHLLQVSQLTTITIPSTLKHRNACRDIGYPFPCFAVHSLLYLMRPLDLGGEPIKTLAVCSVCNRYRPTRRSCWAYVRSENVRLQWTNRVAEKYINRWANQPYTSCPHCARQRTFHVWDKSLF